MRPPRRPHTTRMETKQQDLKSNNLSLNEATDMAQNRTLCTLMSTFDTSSGACHKRRKKKVITVIGIA